MRKAFKDKFSDTKKRVRRVFSKPSGLSVHESTCDLVEERMEKEILLKNELEALKDQISNLKAAIDMLQNESEQKDVSIANLARDKEKITLDLLRTKRSNTALAKQLEEERKFYFKEKEMYCQEMNECKKLKRLISNSSVAQSERAIEEYKNELSKLKQTLNQTLEANYNLSIKFLRMKNSKTCLKTELQTMKIEHEKLANEYKSKMENLTIELSDIVNEKLGDSISPSNKKYLQLVKQNSCLVYENLCLQLEVDNLNFKLEKMQLYQTKNMNNQHLTYIPHKIRPDFRKPKDYFNPIQNETPEKLEKEPEPCCSKYHREKHENHKLYERHKKSVSPNIHIADETKKKEKKQKKKKRHDESQSSKKSQETSFKSHFSVTPDHRINVDENYNDKMAKHLPSKLELFQMSTGSSSTSTNCFLGTNFKRTQSSPDIVQSTNFRCLT